MAEEFTVMEDAPIVALKRKMFFEPGTTVIAKIAEAQWVQGKFSPGVAVEYKTVSPQVGYSIRNTAWLSTRKADGEHFVRNYGELDLIQRAALTDTEFFFLQNVDPNAWIGRPVAFVLDEKVYEDEDGEERRINIVKEGTTRRPTDEELDQVHKDLEGTGILASPSDGKAELEAASESSEEDDSSDEEDDPEREFANIPF
jgi:hypothetical protein